MSFGVRGLLAVTVLLVLLLATVSAGFAVCGDDLADAPGALAAQAAADTQCDCCRARSHRQYVRCVAQVARAAVHAGALRRACKRMVVHRAASLPCPVGTATGQGPICRICNGDADCQADEFCECPVGTCSGTGGTCVTKPQACPEVFAPVCGCKGATYPNDCSRQAAGACKLHDGACQPTCRTDGDCNDGNPCTADLCGDGVCEHVCICVTAGGLACCPGPAALCVRPCGSDASGACGGICPTGASCQSLPGAPTCACVSGPGGPCGGNLLAPPPVCGPGLVCQQTIPDATGVCAVPCIPFFQSGCSVTSDCCQPCGPGIVPPCAVCLQGQCLGVP